MLVGSIVERQQPSVHPHNHIVQFYESDPSLYEAVADFLAEGLRAGEALIVIATAEHRAAFRERLEAKGFGVDVACASGQIVLVDARETLASFMREGRPDSSLFRGTVGQTIEGVLGGRHARIRAYGEMVDLLWRDGLPGAALELEELWNELQRTYPFDLYCAYVMGKFFKETDIAAICDPHSEVRPEDEARVRPHRARLRSVDESESIRALTHEIAERKVIERALRDSMSSQREAQARLERSERELRDFVEAAPLGLHCVGPDGRILWANQAELDLLGYREEEYVGRPIADFHLDRGAIGEVLQRFARENAPHNYETRLLAKDGSCRHVLVSTNACYENGDLAYTRCFTRDITARREAELASEIAVERTRRLQLVTAAIADAITAEQVFEAIVDQMAVALGASSVGLWLVDGQGLLLERSVGYEDLVRETFVRIPLDAALPAVDVVRAGSPLWLSSPGELIERYPALTAEVVPRRSRQLACIPLVNGGQTTGVIAITFDDMPPADEEERAFLLLVARYSSQALERLRLLDAERESRERAEVLLRLAQAVIAAPNVDRVLSVALDAIECALGTGRSAILVADRDGVMRFRAWRSVSDPYRRAMEARTPWPWAVQDPKPFWVANVAEDPSAAPCLSLFRQEGIAASGLIPIAAGGKLLGKFMIGYDEPHELGAAELEIVMAIAHHVASAISRFSAMADLESTVRFNEMFTAMLGHDLRNPLNAIMTAAQLVMMRGESEKAIKPLARILKSGERMSRMIDQLLDFTRLRVGAGIPLDRRHVDLVPLLRQILDELEDANPNWTLRFDHVGDATGHWDGDRLGQVFSNLVGNALQHGIADYGVQVRVEGARNHVRIQVHNMGAVPGELLPNLFEPMTGGERRGRKSQGLGLGMFITEQIIKAHGGIIEVLSSEETGTTFDVLIPRERLPS